jgi:putative aldouronate transport system permease protein
MKALGLSNKAWRGLTPFLFVIPGMCIVFMFEYLPLWGWVVSLYDYQAALGRSLARSSFVGLENFTYLFTNAAMRDKLLEVLRNTFAMHLMGYLLSPLPMIFAVLLSEMHGRKFKKLVQTVSTLPNFISWVIMLSLATALFGSSGAVNNILRMLGQPPVNILTSTSWTSWITMVLLSTWKGLGWSSIIYFAAISGIDQEMYEAAMVDGAGKMQRIWHITMPQLIPTYFVLLIISIGNFLNTGIDQYLAFGNANNMAYVQTLDLYVYRLGIGSGMTAFSVAVGIMKTIVAFVLFFGANWASKKIRGSSVF